MYTLFDYGFMIGPENRARTAAFAEALRQVVHPDSIVLEIGTGVGFFALLAAKFGARHVYALEPNDAIHVAREMAVANGLSDRITFIQASSGDVTLPQRADVIITDIGGAMPLHEGSLSHLIDARERLLVPGGTIIPQTDTLWATVVSMPHLYGKYVGPWDDNAYGLDLGAARRRITNHCKKISSKPKESLVEPQCWATLDYHTFENPNVSARVTWAAPRTATAHGLNLWFDRVLFDGIAISNASGGATNPIYGNWFLPWIEPVELEQGDQISVQLRADLCQGHYVWSWQTEVLAADQATDPNCRNPDSAKYRFKQSNFASNPARVLQKSRGNVPLHFQPASAALSI